MSKRIEWPTVAVLALVLTALCVVWVTGPEHRGDILAGVGAVGALLLAVLRPMLVPPALVLVAVLGASGCGASALRTHATIATVASIAVGGAAPLVAPACDAALTACHGEAQCISETAERCRVASRAMEGAVAGVRGYIDAVEVASLADEGEALPALLAGWQALARLWPTVAAALAAFGVTLPALPEVTP
jgi:hypothetical protein